MTDVVVSNMIAQGTKVVADGDDAVLIGRPQERLRVPTGDASELADILQEHLFRGPETWENLDLIAWDSDVVEEGDG